MRSAAVAHRANKVSTTVRAGSGFSLETSNLIETGRGIKLLTEKECAVGVAFYPDFAYNAEGGVAVGTVTNVNVDGKVAINFDCAQVSIPAVDGSTSDVMGLPLPPLFKAEVVPQSMVGFIEKSTGKVELEVDADITLSAKPLYTSASVRVPLTLTSETSWGATRSARGKRLDSEGRCVLVAVARVPPVSDLAVSAAMMLPSDVLVALQARFEFAVN